MAFKNNDNTDYTPVQINGTVATAGVPVSITESNSNKIQQLLLQNPSRGPNANEINDVLFVNIDGGSFYMSLARGESISLVGDITTIKIDASANATNYELTYWY